MSLNTPENPQADQMADESMVRTLDAQARAIWPQEAQIIDHYELPPIPRILDAGSGTGEGASRLAEHFPQSHVLGVDVIEENLGARPREIRRARAATHFRATQRLRPGVTRRVLRSDCLPSRAAYHPESAQR